MKRGKNRTKQLILLLLSIEVLIVVAGLAYIQLRPMVVEAVTMEAGTKMVDIEDFLLKKNPKGTYLTDINTLDLRNPGVYKVRIKVGNRVLTSSLEVIDTVAPTALAVNQMVLKDEVLEAKAFVKDLSDSTEVTVMYKSIPDFSVIGDQEVTVVLMDTSNNKTELTAVLTVFDIKNSVTIEAGSIMDITVADFVENDKYTVAFETDITKLDISKPATYDVLINVDGRTLTSKIDVVDTTAPKAEITNKTIWNDETPPAIIFINDIDDVSAVSVTYQEIPVYTLLGDQEVTIVLEDESGNKTTKKAILTVKADTEAPVIWGVADQLVYIGDTISYKRGSSVKDNRDEAVSLQVDSSTVNLKKAGIYQVLYTATDMAGNIATKSVNITVKQFIISEDIVNQMSDEILAKIVTNTMTKREKALEIYRWVKNHVGYTGHSDKSDWLMEAYRGIKTGRGDCFTFYAVSQALLTRAGIDNMRVTRIGGKTQHFWNLINCDNGWYHFDTCPHKDHLESFMLTDAEVEDYTLVRGNNYYTFDKTLYPATPK